MILADTSAWIEYDRASGSVIDERMAGLIGTPGALATTEPVVMELLAGARDDSGAEQMRRLLLRCRHLPLDPVIDFDAAAGIYRRCRRAGVTPRGLLDCLIAGVAWRTAATLLSADVDLQRIAAIVSIELDPASLP